MFSACTGLEAQPSSLASASSCCRKPRRALGAPTLPTYRVISMHSQPIFKKCKSDQVTLQVKLPLYSEWNPDPGSQGPAWPGPDCVSGLQSCRCPSAARPQPSSRPAFSWTCCADLQLRAAVVASPLGVGSSPSWEQFFSRLASSDHSEPCSADSCSGLLGKSNQEGS